MKESLYRLLRLSEKYLKTDMVYMTKGSIWLSIGQFIAVLSSLLLSIILAKALPQETYGDYKFVLSIASIIGGLSLSGLGTSLNQAVSQGKDGTIFPIFRNQIIWGIILTLVSLGTSVYYFINGHNYFSLAFIIISVTLPVTNAFGIYGSFLSGKKDFGRGTRYWITSQLVNITLLCIIAVKIPNIILLVLAYFGSNLIMSVFFYIRTLKIYKPDIRNLDNSMIGYGHHLSIMGFIGTLANQLDKVLLFHFIGSAPLAIFSFASAIPEQARSFFKNVFNVGFPKLAQLEERDLRKSIADKIFRLTLISIFIVAIYYFISPYIFKTLFPKYIESVFYSQIYMLGLIVFPGIYLFSTYFQIVKDTRRLYLLNILGNVATIVFGFILIPKYGIFGAVIENSLSWLFMFLLNLIFFIQRRKKIHGLVE